MEVHKDFQSIMHVLWRLYMYTYDKALTPFFRANYEQIMNKCASAQEIVLFLLFYFKSKTKNGHPQIFHNAFNPLLRFCNHLETIKNVNVEVC